MDPPGRVVNLSSAAQITIDTSALFGHSLIELNDVAYAQSKLALTMWSRDMALSLGGNGPAIIAVNPKSMLGSQMVKKAYGVDGHDLSIGAKILCKASLSEDFANASGLYFDNDIGRFAKPHPDALDPIKCKKIVNIIEDILSNILQ